MKLDLRSVVRDVIASSKSVEYADLAAAVFDRIDPADHAEALRLILPVFVREVAVSVRVPGPVRPPKTLSGPKRGWKVAAIRDGWQKRLLEVYATEGGNKRLGDFTHDDLIYQASICETQAKAKLSKAKGWKALADLLEAEGVSRVADLPAETLMPTLGAVA